MIVREKAEGLESLGTPTLLLFEANLSYGKKPALQIFPGVPSLWIFPTVLH